MTPILFILLGLLAQQDPPVTVLLKNGTQLRATMPTEPLKIKTADGERAVPWRQIKSIRRSEEGRVKVRVKEETFEGVIVSEAFELITSLGTLNVPAADLTALVVGPSLHALGVGDAIALLTFDGVEGGRGTEWARMKSFRLVDVKPVPDVGLGWVLQRTAEGGFVELEDKDNTFEIRKEAITFEIRFKLGTISKAYGTLIAKNQSDNANNRDYWLLAHRNGSLYLTSGKSGSTNLNITTKAGGFDPTEWTYAAVSVDPANSRIDFFINGKNVHTYRGSLTFNRSKGPLFIGPGESGAQHFSCPDKIQFVRISRGVLSPLEIAETYEALKEGRHFGLKVETAGIFLRSGGFVASDATQPDGLGFRTTFGALRLGAKTRARIYPARVRREEQGRVREEVEARIGDLTDEDPAVREKAMERLGELGGQAYEVLSKRAEDPDRDLRARVRRLLEGLKEKGAQTERLADVVQLGRGSLSGWLEGERIELDTPYGSFGVDLKDIRMIVISGATPEGAFVVHLRDGDLVEGNCTQEVLELKTEFGNLKLPFADLTSLAFDENAKKWKIQAKSIQGSVTILDEKIPIETTAGLLPLPLEAITMIARKKR